MIELNQWFFVLLANFLILIYVLNIILFKPLLALFKEREKIIDGSLKAAKELEEQKNKALANMQDELARANAKATYIYDALKQEGLEKQRESLERSHEEAMEAVERARVEIAGEADKARQRLRQEIDRYSESIVQKLINV